MKRIKTFEQYDSPDIPKISDEEIKDMTNIRPYHNKVQQGFYHKGSADVNIGIADKQDQEKYDIMTIFHSMSEKYFKNLDLMGAKPDFNWLRGETAHLRYILTREIPTDTNGNVRINMEYALYHNYTGEVYKEEELKDFNEYENTSRVFLSCSVQSYYDKSKEDAELMKMIFADEKDEKFKRASIKMFKADKDGYSKKELEIHEKESEYNNNFKYNEKNIEGKDMEKEIKKCGDIFNNFLNYIDAQYDITTNDLK